MEFMGDNHWAALAGLFAGGALGMSSSIGRFCTLGAIEDALYGNDYSRLRMWALALAVAIASMFTLEALGQVDYSRTIYYSLKWNPIASIVGGLMFGWGMALAGNCGFGALSRMAGGDLRSFVVTVVMAISATWQLVAQLPFYATGFFRSMTMAVSSKVSHTWLAVGLTWALLYLPWYLQ